MTFTIKTQTRFTGSSTIKEHLYQFDSQTDADNAFDYVRDIFYDETREYYDSNRQHQPIHIRASLFEDGRLMQEILNDRTEETARFKV